MTISPFVKSQFFAPDSHELIRLPLRTKRAPKPKPKKCPSFGKYWTLAEHERFLEGLERFPSGPWKIIAAFVGTRTVRQTMSHAQKYREKIARRETTSSLFASLAQELEQKHGAQRHDDGKERSQTSIEGTGRRSAAWRSSIDLGLGAVTSLAQLSLNRFDASIPPPPPLYQPQSFTMSYQPSDFMDNPMMMFDELLSTTPALMVSQDLQFLDSIVEQSLWDFGSFIASEYPPVTAPTKIHV